MLTSREINLAYDLAELVCYPIGKLGNDFQPLINVIRNITVGREAIREEVFEIITDNYNNDYYDHNLWINKVKALNRIKEYYDYKFFEKR